MKALARRVARLEVALPPISSEPRPSYREQWSMAWMTFDEKLELEAILSRLVGAGELDPCDRERGERILAEAAGRRERGDQPRRAP